MNKKTVIMIEIEQTEDQMETYLKIDALLTNLRWHLMDSPHHIGNVTVREIKENGS